MIDPHAVGSDVARSRGQYLRRKVARSVVGLLGLNRCGPLATEIVQAIEPVLTIETEHGPLLCRGGHGRLTWRARTFHTEEPETIAWLDSIGPNDCYWDIGANVGLYACYVAKFCKAKVVACEPEAQNYALLTDNMVLNGAQFDALPIAVHDERGIGPLHVPYLTKSGAYNTFGSGSGWYEQQVFASSVDDLVAEFRLPYPTHIKIDVDGNEPVILAGAKEALKKARSVLVEVNGSAGADMCGLMHANGFKIVSRAPCSRSKTAHNVIFSR